MGKLRLGNSDLSCIIQTLLAEASLRLGTLHPKPKSPSFHSPGSGGRPDYDLLLGWSLPENQTQRWLDIKKGKDREENGSFSLLFLFLIIEIAAFSSEVGETQRCL